MFRSLTLTCVMLMSASCLATTHINPGTVEDVITKADRHEAITEAKQRRTSAGWMQVKSTAEGNYVDTHSNLDINISATIVKAPLDTDRQGMTYATTPQSLGVCRHHTQLPRR